MATYNPGSFFLIVAGVTVEGYAEGSFIKAKRNKELYTQKAGAHGDITDVRSTDKSGTVTVTLQATSNTNDAFSALLIADEAAPNGTMSLPILVKDTNGTTICAGSGRLKGWPELDVSVDEPHREWVFNMKSLQFFVGGSGQ